MIFRLVPIDPKPNFVCRLDGTLSPYTTAVGYVNTNTYGREHVYEMQLCKLFLCLVYINLLTITI
jgi:hypothetical protein